MCQEKTPGTLKPGMLETARTIQLGIDKGFLLPGPRVSFQDREFYQPLNLVYSHEENNCDVVEVACILEKDKNGQLVVGITGPSHWNNKLVGMGWATFFNKADEEASSMHLRFAPAIVTKDYVNTTKAVWLLEDLDQFGELDFGIKPWDWEHLTGREIAKALFDSAKYNREDWKLFLENTNRELPSEARLAIDWGLGKHSPRGK